ncbi:uncharacterized protein TEOVI_000125500 [Trypanosoma equiperdum]|uniref:Trypanosome variant surface glycoprotein C-terminal domain-containing protein n=1 Tax=Trypanosoma equiperdum TaxID=5694 RepID=A0A1G4IBT6_TRYEQ|nr:hypothetical protein TEOVI_000125500 [Trypanosoma equiperdum]
METVLGTDDTKLIKLWTEIGNDNIEEVTKSAGTTVKASTLTDDQRLLRTLSYYIIGSQAQVRSLQSDKEAAQESCRRGASNPEEACNAIGDSEAKKCNATENCHFDNSKAMGKKCTLKKEVKSELEKASQETGVKDGKTDCSSHQDQKSCEAVNTAAKPATCRWRKGKDNEPEPDK